MLRPPSFARILWDGMSSLCEVARGRLVNFSKRKIHIFQFPWTNYLMFEQVSECLFRTFINAFLYLVTNHLTFIGRNGEIEQITKSLLYRRGTACI